MAGNIHKSCAAAFKAKVALEALKGKKTMAELSSEWLNNAPNTCPFFVLTMGSSSLQPQRAC